MDGFSSHTFSLWNAEGERFWVKWHFKTQQGIRNMPAAEAMRIAGEDPDYHRRDLHEAIERGDYPKWTVKVQIMPEKDAETYDIHPFDLTKVWHYRDYPLVEVGVLQLNRNPKNHFAEVEQAAFEPGNLPPGMGASPDKMLQARLLSYPDAHRYRIGVNYAALDVNKPRCPVHSYHRDGQMRFDGNGGDSPVYEPNSFNGPAQDPSYREPPLRVSGDADRWEHRSGNEEYRQAGDLFRLMSDEEKGRLISHIVEAMRDVPRDIQVRQIHHFLRADPAYGRAVAEGLGIEVADAA